MKYKNLFFAFSLEFLLGLSITLLIVFLGPKSIVFLALFAIRPFILERENITSQDDFWFYSFQLGKISLLVLSLIIIVLYLIDELFVNEDFLFHYTDRIIVLIPFYLFLHGLFGLISLIIK
ncbi:MAG: hypothetical protein PHW27_08535 [Melioribacteraceae bacterium]|nr:hypothetical protein [Melioribacteraceae bacterium]MDD3558606.1 hypothetical protein [Melioribacteraceae bacterium]